MQYAYWDQDLSETDNDEILTELAFRHFKRAGEAGTIAAYHLVCRDYPRLMSVNLDYGRLSCEQARNLRQGLSLFSKRSDIDLGIDKREVAWKKFVAAEEACRLTNECFRARRNGKFQFPASTERVTWHASRKIMSILGDAPKLVDLRFRFGPGATTQIPKRMASSRAKLGINPACSIELSPYKEILLAEMPAWAEALKEAGPLPMDLHEGKVVFVPKSAKEDRTVVVEPSLNTMVQAGIGSLMAERLRNAGVDIRDQSRNQRLARKGSMDGTLATVDLSSASDTVSLELVKDLIPEDWYHLLATSRTGWCKLRGSDRFKLEKFSGMGNGYTFPLETCIFYALAFGVCVELGLSTREVTAYGDDIILPTAAYDLLEDVLTRLGFTVNREKSFREGPFRESCGADYYEGIDIRPVYQKTGLRVRDLFRLHNHYYRWFEHELCEYLQSYIDPSIRIFGPDGYGDGHLLGEWVPVRKPSFNKKGYCGGIFDTFTDKPIRSLRRSLGDRVLPCYSIYLRGDGVEPEDDFRDQRVFAGLLYCGHKPRLWDPVDPPSAAIYTDGLLSVPLPGALGIKRVSIYTFTS